MSSTATSAHATIERNAIERNEPIGPPQATDHKQATSKGYLIALVRETVDDRCKLKAYGK